MATDADLSEYRQAVQRRDGAFIRDFCARYPELVNELVVAADDDDRELVTLLLQCRPKDPDLWEYRKAVERRDFAPVRDFFAGYPRHLRSQLLEDAARANDVDLLAVLVECGAEIEQSGPATVLSEAASGGAVEALRWLLTRGAKVNFQYSGGRSPRPYFCH